MPNPRPSWTGVIGFGALDVPALLLPATDDAELSLSSVHATDLGELVSHRTCKRCGNPVTASEIIKCMDGVALTDDDIKAIAPASREKLVISEFVPIASIPLEYYEKPYVVQAGDGDKEGFAAFYAACYGTRLAALGKVSFRGRERLCAIIARAPAMMLYLLRFESEIRQIDSVVPLVSARNSEVAIEIVRTMTSPGFMPSKYQDFYTTALVKLVQMRKKPAPRKSVESALAGTLRTRRKAA